MNRQDAKNARDQNFLKPSSANCVWYCTPAVGNWGKGNWFL